MRRCPSVRSRFVATGFTATGFIAAVAAGSLLLAVPVVPALALATTATSAASRGAAAPTTHHLTQAPLTATQAARLSRHVTDRVIVLLKDQPRQDAEGTAAARERAATVSASQEPLIRELDLVHATGVRRYQLINGVAATVSAGEAARLAASPAVARVIPDGPIYEGETPSAPGSAEAAGTTGTTKATGATGLGSDHIHPFKPLPGACLPDGRVELEPEGLGLTHTASLNPKAATARSLGITGAGVKVAWMADGIDIRNANLLRPDGKSVFVDYRDFTGEGTAAVTNGDEPFIDANTIAGQGLRVYDTQYFSAQVPTAPCNIRIEGVAPGASLVGLKVFGTDESSTTSGFIAAINYAVETDHVNIIDQSFGANSFPDQPDEDAVTLADEAATAAGVTVACSSGDAGPYDTIDSPASDPAVISAGASTDYRFYAQTNYAAADLFAKTGWLNDNVSPLSSGGYTQAGGTVDLLAPGDSSFASCQPTKDYFGCVNLKGQLSDLEVSGGTSEAAPWVAGTAALVIQAFRKTHHGATPAPALIKRILLSTATDLGAPADEQGAGLVNAYQAVLMAESVKAAGVTPTPAGDTLLVNTGTASAGTVSTGLGSTGLADAGAASTGLAGSGLASTGAAGTGQLNAVAAPGTAEHWRVTLTNTGAGTQTVRLSGRTFGPPLDEHTGAVTLSDTASPHFVNYANVATNYGVLHFDVPPGAARLYAAIGYPGDPASGNVARVRLILIDPRGRFAAHSLPQGVGNFGSVDVQRPAAGQWTAIIYSAESGVGGTVGRVHFEDYVNDTARFGSVTPATLTLAPGASGAVTVAAATPASPGDTSGSVIMNAGHGVTTIPVTLRSLVDVTHGGAFSGVITGGNGRPAGERRPGAEGQVLYYQFSVPAGQPGVAVGLRLHNDPRDQVGAYLIDPAGNVAGYGSNQLAVLMGRKDALRPDGSGGTSPRLTLAASALSPEPGLWTLAVDAGNQVVGNEVADPFTGTVRFGAAAGVSASGLPDSAGDTLTAGQPVTAQVRIHNTGAAPEDFFLDPRLTTTGRVTLAPVSPASGVTLPLAPTATPPEWLVPPQTASVTVTSQASLPAGFSFGPATGDPDLLSAATPDPDAATGTDTPAAGSVTAGLWQAVPAETTTSGWGQGQGGAPAGTVSLAMTAQTQKFDPAVTSTAGDWWARATDPGAPFSVFIVKPGQTRAMTVTITPAGPAGHLVRGHLYVDDVAADLAPYGSPGGSELAALPYEYTIG